MRAMTTPLIHVLIVNWKGRPHVEACFETLLTNDYPAFRVVLLDNASQDGSLELVEERFAQDPRVEIVRCGENLGWSRANNVGIQRALEAGAGYVFLLNDDTACAPDVLRELAAMAEAHPERGVLAPKMVLFGQPCIINSLGVVCSIVGAGWDRGLGRLDGPKWDEPEQVLGACGGAMLIRCDALAKTGLLPTDFDIYLDDLDLCLRIWNAGYEVWTCPSAVVRHKFSATMGQGAAARRKYYLNTRNRMKLVTRNFPWRHMLAVKLAMLQAESRAVGRAVLDGQWWRVAAHAKAWLAGAAYLPAALRHRAAMRRKGLASCKFWDKVQKHPLFFPGIELPEEGWYSEREIKGHRLRPISKTAHFDAVQGSLRVIHANCYPHMGETDVVLRMGEETLTRLRTLDVEETLVNVPRTGRMSLESNHIFDAGDTGEPIDAGGWLRLENSG